MSRSFRDRILLSLPIEIHFKPTWGRYDTDHIASERFPYVGFLSGLRHRDRSLAGPARSRLDPWVVRDDLLRDHSDFESFTAFYGRFGGSTGPDLRTRLQGRRLQGSRGLLIQQMALENEFRDWGQLLTAAVGLPRHRWASLKDRFSPSKVAAILRPLPLTLVQDGKRLLGLVEVFDVLGAVLATLWVDHLQGADFRYCAHCGKPFIRRTRHERIYCYDGCGHYVAVKKSRRRKKESLSERR